MRGNEESEEEEEEAKKKKKAKMIEIPSYEGVLHHTQSKPNPPSLFSPSLSFSQAFSSIKNSEFYSPPPINPNPNPNPNSSSSSSSMRNEINSNTAAAGPSSSSSPAFVQKSNAIFVSHRQKGNLLLKHIRNVRWDYADVIPDYVLGQNTCALYISLRYHLLHPDYLYYRIRELQKNFRLRVVLCHIDVEDVVKPLLEITRTALLHDCTLLCGWSLEECGRYLETIKVYENKPADIIQGHMDTDYLSRLNYALTAIRHVNKTDVVTLGSTFGSLSNIMDASMEDLARCPGIGERKVKRLYDTFHEPFRRVVPNHTVGSEPLAQSNTNNSSLSSETPSSEKKEPQLTVKSALSVAFAKYSRKLGVEKETGGGIDIQKESDGNS